MSCVLTDRCQVTLAVNDVVDISTKISKCLLNVNRSSQRVCAFPGFWVCEHTKSENMKTQTNTKGCFSRPSISSVSCFHLFCFQFAASTHGPLDAISLASEDLAHPGSRQLDNNDNSTDSLLQGGLQHNQDLGARTSAELRPRASSTLDLRASEVGSKSGDLFQSGNLGSPRDKMAAAEMFQTSDLGTSDFSSSELWPSASPSPFDYSQRYR